MNYNVKNEILSVWLDVAKEKIDVCFMYQSKETYQKIENSKDWLEKFIEELQRQNVNSSIPFILESTWDCHVLCALLLKKWGFNVKEINPIITHQYIKHSIRWTKTDKTDSKMLWRIWVLEWERLKTFDRSEEAVILKKKVSLIASLEKQIQSFKRMLSAHEKQMKIMEVIWMDYLEWLKDSLKRITKQKELLQKAIEMYEYWDEEVNTTIKIIDSITWISPYIAKVCYIIFASNQFYSKKAMLSFIGLDPKLKQSWKKNEAIRLSKRWNGYARLKLFQAAFWAVKHCEYFRKLYQKYKDNGKHYYVALLGVARKIVYIMRSLIKNRTLFNPNYQTI